MGKTAAGHKCIKVIYINRAEAMDALKAQKSRGVGVKSVYKCDRHPPEDGKEVWHLTSMTSKQVRRRKGMYGDN